MSLAAIAPAAAHDPPAAPVFRPLQLRLLLLGLGLATGMEFYTFDSVNLVLPDLTGALGVSGDEASWLLTVYSSALFIGVPISIWLAGHFGYKRYLIGTVLLYAGASVGCATAPDLSVMLVWRAIQGFAGAGLVVWWRASIYVLLPKPQRSPALMQASTVLYLSSATGLLVSGYVTDHLHWRLIFLPCLIYATAAIWLLSVYFPKLPRPTAPRVVETDWPGIALLAVGLIALQIILSRGDIDDWFGSPRIRLLAGVVAAALALFAVWQASPRNPAPLIWLDLLRDPRVTSAALLGVFTGMILSGSLFVLPEFLRNVSAQTHSATQTGRFMCLYALTAAAVRPLMVGLIARLGQRKTIVIALGLLIVSMALLNRLLTTDTPDIYFVAPLILYGLCLSPLLPAVGSGTVAKIEQNKLLDGVSIYMTFRQFGASLGVALLTILITRREALHSSRLVEHLRGGDARTLDWLGSIGARMTARSGDTAFEAHRMAAKALADAVEHQSATLSYADAFAFMAVIGVLAVCCLPLIPPTPGVSK